jgi:cellobiose-specific phosphotransferase system component IIC
MKPGITAAIISTSAALLAAGSFLAATILTGDYDWVARLGGAGWVFLLSMIILMPTITPWMKRRMGRAESASHSAHQM